VRSQDDPLAVDGGAVVAAGVLTREPVDVGTRLRSGDRLHHPTSDLNVEVGGIRVDDQNCHPWIAPDVTKLLAVHLGVEQHVLAVGVNPHRLGHRGAARQQCRDRGEVPSPSQLDDSFLQHSIPFAVTVLLHRAVNEALGVDSGSRRELTTDELERIEPQLETLADVVEEDLRRQLG
jgi:hypothetical protein